MAAVAPTTVLNALSVEGWDQVVVGTEGWALAWVKVECLRLEDFGLWKEDQLWRTQE